jgi:hypothetical protein
MGQLRDRPLDELKIDRAFVRTMLAKPANERIVHSMVGTGKSLGLKVLAEGVEDAATRDRLGMQGYLIGKPPALARVWGTGQCSSFGQSLGSPRDFLSFGLDGRFRTQRITLPPDPWHFQPGRDKGKLIPRRIW